MELKIDTKEKYQLLTPAGASITAIIAAEIVTICNKCLESAQKNMVLNLENVEEIAPDACQILTDLQQAFYDKSASFVMCCLNTKLEDSFDGLGLLEVLNLTPTLSEASDIVMMEEIERELLDSDDFEFDKESE
jgi:anti-anti-sigma regulatory factor